MTKMSTTMRTRKPTIMNIKQLQQKKDATVIRHNKIMTIINQVAMIHDPAGNVDVALHT